MAERDKQTTAINLDRLTVQELTALRDAAEAKRREKLDEAREAVLAETRSKLAELGLTLDALLPTRAPTSIPAGRRPRKDAGGSVAAKFRGPNGEQWSGRGRMPRWLSALEAGGRSRDEFRV